MALQHLLRQFGRWTTLERWREPLLYRVRLKGDLLFRLLLAFAIGAAATCVLLVLFAINIKPPHPANALFGMLLVGGGALLLLVQGSSTAGGNVRICQEGVCRKRNYVGFSAQWFEEASWPYERIEQCVIVPGQAIGESFSLLFLSSGGEWDIVGIPSRIDVARLAQFLSTQGIMVQPGSMVPPQFASGMNVPFSIASGAMGFVLLAGGLGFYLVNASPRRVAEARRFERPDLGVDFPSAPHPPRTAPREQAAITAGGNGTPAETTTPPADAAAPLDVAPTATPPIVGFPGHPGAAGSPNGMPATVIGPAPPINRPSGARSELAGGSGGFPFELSNPRQQPVLGFRYAQGSWGSSKGLAKLDPLYAAEAGGPDALVARDGYVVSALEVDAGQFVHAVRVVFARQNGNGQIDPGDTYTSAWLGSRTDQSFTTLSGGTRPLIGVYGRRGALIDALGIIMADNDQP